MLLFVAILASSSFGQEPAVPVEIQLSLLLKVLSFDRAASNRENSPVVIGIVYQSGFRRSVIVRDAIEDAAEALKNRPGGSRVTLEELDLDADPLTENWLRQHRVRAVYAAPMRGIDLGPALDAAAAAQVLTCSAVGDYIDAGFAVGFEVNADRTRIVINLDAAKSEGADFSAQLLKLARVIR